jgi:two-component system KDP operon response regulator KdpE
VTRDATLVEWVPRDWRAVPLAIEDGAAAMEQRLGLVDVVAVDARRSVCVELVRLLAERGTPVVVLTDQDGSDVRERGYLEAGADAVIDVAAPSPFVRARLDALVRATSRGATPSDVWTAGGIEVSVERREVRRAGSVVRLTRTEFDVLATLTRRGGAAVPARTLAALVWGADTEDASHSVRVYIHRLRDKLEEDSRAPRLIVREHDGYRLEGARAAVAASAGPLRLALIGAPGVPGAEALRAGLEREGVRCFEVDVLAPSDERADAVLAFGGGDVLRFVRRAPEFASLPLVAVLPADDETATRALERGADDVVQLDAGSRAVRARLEAAVRHSRRARGGGGPTVRTGDLLIDRAAHRAYLAGDEVDLTPREFDVLDVLAESAGRVVSHGELLARVWGEGCRSEVHLVRMYVAYLRSKLEAESARPRYLVNEWGCGYRLALWPPRT